MQTSEFDDDETDALAKLISFDSNLNFLNPPNVKDVFYLFRILYFLHCVFVKLVGEKNYFFTPNKKPFILEVGCLFHSHKHIIYSQQTTIEIRQIRFQTAYNVIIAGGQHCLDRLLKDLINNNRNDIFKAYKKMIKYFSFCGFLK